MMKLRQQVLCTLFVCTMCLTAFAQETRQVRGFDAVANSTSIDMVLRQGNNESVRLDVTGIDLDEIVTEVSGGTLKIRTRKNGWNWNKWKNVRGKIYVTYRSLESIHNSGASDIICETLLSGDDLSVHSSGAGNVRLTKVEVEELDVHVSGSSDVVLRGNIEELEVSVSGSGDIDAADLDCEEAEVRVSGSGNITLVARESLKAAVSGSGDIKYYGSPEHVDTRVSGSGNIRSASR